MKYIEFSNEILSPLFSSLSSFKLDVTDSITRRKFLRLIKYIVADKEETVNEISIKYSVKNTDRKPHILDNGRYEYTKEGRNSLYSDLKKLERPVGIKIVSFGLSVRGSSTQARRSSPAL